MRKGLCSERSGTGAHPDWFTAGLYHNYMSPWRETSFVLLSGNEWLLSGQVRPGWAAPFNSTAWGLRFMFLRLVRNPAGWWPGSSRLTGCRKLRSISTSNGCKIPAFNFIFPHRLIHPWRATCSLNSTRSLSARALAARFNQNWRTALPAGVFSALPVLEAARSGRLTGLGQRVIVVGGGNVALDAAVVAKRTGAEQVILLYRRGKTEMPGWESEYLEACELGVEFRWLSVVDKIITQPSLRWIRTGDRCGSGQDAL